MMQRPGPHTHNCCGGRDVRFEQVGELLFDIRVRLTPNSRPAAQSGHTFKVDMIGWLWTRSR